MLLSFEVRLEGHTLKHVLPSTPKTSQKKRETQQKQKKRCRPDISYRCEISLFIYAYALLFLGFEYNIIKLHAIVEDKDAEMAFLSEEHSNTTAATGNSFVQVADKQSK